MTEQNKNGKDQAQNSVIWSVLFERTLIDWAVDALLDIALINGRRGYQRISVPYMRTDMARNRICQSFLEVTKDSNDVLVMLDGDHVHPHDIVVRLAGHDPELGVVGALYFRRGEPYDPLFFRRQPDGKLRNPAEWDAGMIYEADAVGTGAVAIRRWVLEQLTEAGLGYPFFQYAYPSGSGFSMTEDIFFAQRCEKLGIRHYCDTSIITPHLGRRIIDQRDWEAYKAAHPEALETID